jgi:hypothetical protein
MFATKDKPTATSLNHVEIVSALFVEHFELRSVPGPSTRIDIQGAMFSLPAPSPVPVTITPHLVVLIRCPLDEVGNGALEVRFVNSAGVEVARNVSPFTVEPGKFTYRLVRGELPFDSYDTIEAHCRINLGHELVVPLTLLPPVSA